MSFEFIAFAIVAIISFVIGLTMGIIYESDKKTQKLFEEALNEQQKIKNKTNCAEKTDDSDQWDQLINSAGSIT